MLDLHNGIALKDHQEYNEFRDMAPSAIVPEIVDYVQPKKDTLGLPAPARARLEKANIDLSNGYPVSFCLVNLFTNTNRSDTHQAINPTHLEALQLQHVPQQFREEISVVSSFDQTGG